MLAIPSSLLTLIRSVTSFSLPSFLPRSLTIMRLDGRVFGVGLGRFFQRGSSIVRGQPNNDTYGEEKRHDGRERGGGEGGGVRVGWG